MPVTRVIIFISLILVLPLHLVAQTPSTKVDLGFEQKIPTLLQETNVPAVGIGVIEDGKLKYAKVFGELKRGIPAPNNTLFQIASLTKPIVEILTLQLVSAGQWKLDEPLARYWVDPDVKDDTRHQKLTTRHVLMHQTGFPNWRSDTPTKKLSFTFDPGTKVSYSGEGLEYLRHALEAKFKQPLDQLARTQLFSTYGMKDTHFYWDSGVNEARFAAAHDKTGKPFEIRKNSSANAADLLLTTITDYGQFAVNVMKSKGLSKEVFAEMWRPLVAYPDGKNLFFGLGWMIMPDLSNGEYAVIHTGSDDGVKTVIVLLPKSRRGLIVFTNGENGTGVWTKIVADAFDIGSEMLSRG